MLVRAPRHPALRPLVQRLWSSSGGEGPHRLEWVLPTGAAHLVFRLGSPLVLFPTVGGPGERIGTAVVGGPRDGPYLRALGESGPSVGAQLAPGALPLVLGVPAHELAGRHFSLSDLWGGEAELFRERLAATPAERRLDLFEEFLLLRCLPRAPDPVVEFALDLLHRSDDVGAVARATGFSHRHFIERFRRSVGLLPSTYRRLLRFQQGLRLHARGSSNWAEIAYAVGYADQAHLSREFRRLAQMPPRTYASRVGRDPNHVPA